ncbi:MAG: hypothetical protein AAF799_39040 [Myxococcota bacterium]
MLLAALSLTGSFASGCSVETVDDPTPTMAEETLHPRAAGSEQLQQAMAQVDLAVEMLTTTPEPDIPWVLDEVQEIAAEIDFVTLSESEQKLLDEYVKSKKDEVLPVLSLINGHGVPFDDDPFTPSPQDGLCSAYCLLFFQFACEDGTFMGLCLGAWDCGDQMGLHECGNAVPEVPGDCGGDVCDADERCARWVFKPHECVETCDDDSDCSNPAHQCKQPIGTSFKRCK